MFTLLSTTGQGKIKKKRQLTKFVLVSHNAANIMEKRNENYRRTLKSRL